MRGLAALAQPRPAHPSWQDRKRHLQQCDYLSLLLLALVNPTIRTLRALSAASRVARVQQEVGTRYASLGSLSEAQPLVDPQRLEPLIASLSQEIQGPAPSDPRQAWQVWLARDSSIFQATARMCWAQYGAGKAGQPKLVPLEVVIKEDRSLSVRERDPAGRIVSDRPVTRADFAQIFKDPKVPVLVAGDKNVRYEAVLQVMDDLRAQGVERVGLQVKPRQ